MLSVGNSGFSCYSGPGQSNVGTQPRDATAFWYVVVISVLAVTRVSMICLLVASPKHTINGTNTPTSTGPHKGKYAADYIIVQICVRVHDRDRDSGGGVCGSSFHNSTCTCCSELWLDTRFCHLLLLKLGFVVVVVGGLHHSSITSTFISFYAFLQVLNLFMHPAILLGRHVCLVWRFYASRRDLTNRWLD